MQDWGDNYAHLRFAPGCLEGAPPYIDRLSVFCQGAELLPLPGVSRDDLLEQLAAGRVLGNRRHNRLHVARGWLFSGVIHLNEQEERSGVYAIAMELGLNPTRFLQSHSVPNSSAQRNEIAAEPYRSLRKQRWGANNLYAVEATTLDGNSNFLLHSGVGYGQITDWDVRIREYLDLVLRLLQLEFQRVLARVGYQGARFRNPIDFGVAAWSLKHAEYYWELATRDAIAKIETVRRSFMAVLVDPEEALYPPSSGRDRNAPYIHGMLGRESIQAKLYAKSSDIVRYELAYKRNPARCLREDLTRENPLPEPSGDIDNLINLIVAVGEDAHSRAKDLWRAFWDRHAASTRAVVTAEDVANFIAEVVRAAEGSQLAPSALLSLLIHHDGAERFVPASHRDVYDPIGELQRGGVLERLQTSSTRRARYAVSRRWRPVVDSLHQMLSATQPVEEEADTELWPDEEPSPRRRRHRIPRFDRES